MTSQINPAYPVFGTPTTQSVRDNFQYAHDEVEQLQNGKLDLTGGTVNGPLAVTTGPFSVDTILPLNFVIRGVNNFHVQQSDWWTGVIFDQNNLNAYGSYLRMNRNNLLRWCIYLGDDTAESGSNNGTDFKISYGNDAGQEQSVYPIFIKRSTGQVIINGNAVPAPSNIMPLLEQPTGAIGTSTMYARADHIHPAKTIMDGGNF